MKKGKKEKINIIRSGEGSFELVRKNKSKGIFYCIDKSGKIYLIDNIIHKRENSFNNIDEFKRYIEDNY